jgi:predicted Zn-dependent peptidase
MDHLYRLTTLPNGARIATVEMPYMRSVAVGIWAAVGGRHESAPESGISHFLEHLLFKGTKARNARQITESVEGIGGYLNAFTTEDHTCYYAKAAVAHFGQISEVLADMYLRSQFPKSEIEREREVIREEILMYRDQPSQHAQELLTQTMWPGHPLGRPLTGTLETISSMQRGDFLDFRRANYNARTTIITVAGPLPHERVVAELTPHLRQLPAGRNPRYTRARLPKKPASVTVHFQETEQTHLAMGFHAFGRNDQRRYALKLLSVILGENMSSRLFQKLREQRGYCYHVSTNMVALADAGAICISAGLDLSKLKSALTLILRELRNICAKKPGQDEIKKARDYAIGITLMGLESTTNQIMWMGESILGYGRILDPGEVERAITSVTAEDIQGVACHCLNRGRLGVAVVGPLKDASRVEQWIAG